MPPARRKAQSVNATLVLRRPVSRRSLKAARRRGLTGRAMKPSLKLTQRVAVFRHFALKLFTLESSYSLDNKCVAESWVLLLVALDKCSTHSTAPERGLTERRSTHPPSGSRSPAAISPPVPDLFPEEP